jgi:hypothetical protein
VPIGGQALSRIQPYGSVVDSRALFAFHGANAADQAHLQSFLDAPRNGAPWNQPQQQQQQQQPVAAQQPQPPLQVVLDHAAFQQLLAQRWGAPPAPAPAAAAAPVAPAPAAPASTAPTAMTDTATEIRKSNIDRKVKDRILRDLMRGEYHETVKNDLAANMTKPAAAAAADETDAAAPAEVDGDEADFKEYQKFQRLQRLKKQKQAAARTGGQMPMNDGAAVVHSSVAGGRSAGEKTQIEALRDLAVRGIPRDGPRYAQHEEAAGRLRQFVYRNRCNIQGFPIGERAETQIGVRVAASTCAFFETAKEEDMSAYYDKGKGMVYLPIHVARVMAAASKDPRAAGTGGVNTGGLGGIGLEGIRDEAAAAKIGSFDCVNSASIFDAAVRSGEHRPIHIEGTQVV